MSEKIIKVERLGKKFIIGHKKAEKYTALRDVMTDNTKKVFRKTREIFSGKLIGETESREEFWALRNLNFDIAEGDRVGIIGRNGAGKSTLLKILSRISEPTEGKITINGRVASLLEVGTGFHPELTGRENIFLNGAILGMKRAEIRSKFDEIVSFAEVEKFLDTPVKRYSSGMYVRLAFAVAAHLEPEILVVDEVLAVGDAQFQRKCLGKMEEVSKYQGRTVLFVSHQIDAIESLTTKCIYLKGGTIDSIGNTSEITHHYLKDYKGTGDIVSYSNRSGSGKAKVVKLEIKSKNARGSMIKQGESFQLIIGIENASNDKLDVSFVLENYKEQAIFCTQLSDNNPLIDRNGYTEKVVEITVPHLRKGDYLGSLAVFRQDRTEFHDIVLHFPLLSIDGVEEGVFFPQDNRWGDLFFNLQWK